MICRQLEDGYVSLSHCALAPAAAAVVVGCRHIQPAAIAPPKFTREQLAGLKAPVLVITGRDDVTGGGIETAGEASRLFSNVQCEVFPAKHMFGNSNLAAALEQVLQFLAAHKAPAADQ